jgi:protease-4
VVVNLEGEMDLIAQPKKGLMARFNPPPPGVNQLVHLLERAAESKVKGFVFKLWDCPLNPAQIEELQRCFKILKAKGKKIVFWSKAYDTPGYWLASAASTILLQPGGRIANLGLKSSSLYMADALEKVGIELDAVQINPYKSAADRFTRNSMSEEVRAMTGWLLDSRYQILLKDLETGRRPSGEAARAMVDNSPYTAPGALAAGVVDALINQEDLAKFLGTSPEKLVSIHQIPRLLPRLKPTPPGTFALIRVTGAIVDGRSARPQFAPPLPLPLLFDERAGDISVVEQVEVARKNKLVKGVLLYVDSGGGSATASEAMASALEQLAAEKPLVALMGAVAASGGYYVTTPAHWVVASPSTITGSIGVLTAKLVDQAMVTKLLLNRETLVRGERADMEGSARKYSPQERELVWEGISSIYNLFLERVAKARNKTAAEVDKVGGGRVWTGQQALALGLVDELGGLNSALAKLRELAGVQASLREAALPKAGKLPASPLVYAVDSINHLHKAQYCLISPIWQNFNGA